MGRIIRPPKSFRAVREKRGESRSPSPSKKVPVSTTVKRLPDGSRVIVTKNFETGKHISTTYKDSSGRVTQSAPQGVSVSSTGEVIVAQTKKIEPTTRTGEKFKTTEPNMEGFAGGRVSAVFVGSKREGAKKIFTPSVSQIDRPGREPVKVVRRKEPTFAGVASERESDIARRGGTGLTEQQLKEAEAIKSREAPVKIMIPSGEAKRFKSFFETFGLSKAEDIFKGVESGTLEVKKKGIELIVSQRSEFKPSKKVEETELIPTPRKLTETEKLIDISKAGLSGDLSNIKGIETPLGKLVTETPILKGVARVGAFLGGITGAVTQELIVEPLKTIVRDPPVVGDIPSITGSATLRQSFEEKERIEKELPARQIQLGFLAAGLTEIKPPGVTKVSRTPSQVLRSVSERVRGVTKTPEAKGADFKPSRLDIRGQRVRGFQPKGKELGLTPSEIQATLREPARISRLDLFEQIRLEPKPEVKAKLSEELRFLIEKEVPPKKADSVEAFLKERFVAEKTARAKEAPDFISRERILKSLRTELEKPKRILFLEEKIMSGEEGVLTGSFRKGQIQEARELSMLRDVGAKQRIKLEKLSEASGLGLEETFIEKSPGLNKLLEKSVLEERQLTIKEVSSKRFDPFLKKKQPPDVIEFDAESFFLGNKDSAIAVKIEKVLVPEGIKIPRPITIEKVDVARAKIFVFERAGKVIPKGKKPPIWDELLDSKKGQQSLVLDFKSVFDRQRDFFRFKPDPKFKPDLPMLKTLIPETGLRTSFFPLLKQISKPVLGQAISPIQFTSVESRTDVIPRTKLMQEVELVQESSLRQRIKADVIQEKVLIPESIVEQEQRLIPSRFVDEFVTERVVTDEPPPPPPPDVPPPILLPGIPEGKKKRTGFDVLVRESRPKGKSKRKFFKVNTESLPRNKALNMGADIVDNSSARTFKIVTSKKTTDKSDDVMFNRSHKFRRPKGRTRLPSGSYVEESKHLIDTSGERKGITAKGLIALRNKSKAARSLVGNKKAFKKINNLVSRGKSLRTVREMLK